MEKIKGFQISSMTVSGFKCYEAPMKITFGNPTIVTGGNGRGKSSIADGRDRVCRYGTSLFRGARH